MLLRHPIVFRWSPYIEESLEYLATSPDALPSDRWLCDLVRLQHIAEEVSIYFSMDDPGNIVSITDPRILNRLKGFELELDQWRQKVTQTVALRKFRLLQIPGS